jgi:hypothetical protein
MAAKFCLRNISIHARKVVLQFNSKYAIEMIVTFFKKNPDDDPRIETRVGVTIYNKNYKKVVLSVH